MKMESIQCEFVVFDAQDVITTSGGWGPNAKLVLGINPYTRALGGDESLYFYKGNTIEVGGGFGLCETEWAADPYLKKLEDNYYEFCFSTEDPFPAGYTDVTPTSDAGFNKILDWIFSNNKIQ